MAYTPQQRMKRLWDLVREDPDCIACFLEMQESEAKMARYTDDHPQFRELWAYPVCMHTYFHRVLEVVSRELRLPEEK